MKKSLVPRLMDRVRAAPPFPSVADISQSALIMTADGGLVEANGAAARFARALLSGALPDARQAICRAARDGVGVSGRAMIDAEGSAVTCDFDVIPLGRRRALVMARHGALESNLRDALVDSRRRYKDLVEVSSDFAWEIGADGTFVFVSPGGALGWRADELLGRPPEAFVGTVEEVAGDDDEDLPGNPFRARHATTDAEVWFRRADSTLACLSASARPLYDDQGEWIGARGICRDVSENRERDSLLARAHARERLFGYIVRTMRDEVEPANMLAAAANAIARAVTARGTEIYRIGPDGVTRAAGCGPEAPQASSGCIGASLNRPGLVAVTGDGMSAMAVATRYQGEANGVLFLWRDGNLGPFADDERELVVEAAEHLAIAIEQIAAHDRLKELSATDAMTGLLNRRSFLVDLARRFERAAQGGRRGALVYCDLDNFKQVNDTHGHERGDAAICKAAAILRGATRGEDLVARLGGDEFALWLEGTDADAISMRAEDLLARAKELVEFSGSNDAPLGMSLGIALVEPASAESLEQLMARADGAMYASKKSGKGQCTIAPPPEDRRRRAGGQA